MLVLLVFLVFLASTQAEVTPGEFVARPISKEARGLTGKALVDYVNENQPFFKAEYSPENAQRRLGSLMKKEFFENPIQKEVIANAEEPVINDGIPESFDARTKWKECPSITQIRDQSKCGSCWAVSAAETMSDRLCIHSNGTIKNVCKPYVFHPCGRHQGQKYYGECPKHMYKTPVCKRYCQYGYGKRYENDKFYAKAVYGIFSFEPVRAIQTNIMKKGPVQAAFTVYEDFVHYKSGIYVHTAGNNTGRHAVKIIGWGVENGTKYWTIANSWNTDWGEDGYFRILRGENHCGIEAQVYAGDF
uniref:Pept_C1 domain-containing protein n=1 Tax=Haemonchus contortus TaxID=6289 RepID=A0A7I4XSQ5_HAECO